MNRGADPLRDLGPFANQPPAKLVWDGGSLSVWELEALKLRWSQKPSLARHVRDLEIILALRRRDREALRALAVEFRRHRHPDVYRDLTWEEAEAFCQELGGHLVTITSRENDELVGSLTKGGRWFGMRLRGATAAPNG